MNHGAVCRLNPTIQTEAKVNKVQKKLSTTLGETIYQKINWGLK